MPIQTFTIDHARKAVLIWQASLAEATVRLHVRTLKAAFNDAIRDRLIEHNPWESIPSRSLPAPPSEMQMIPAGEVLRVCDHCNDPALVLVIALARFAGLRVSSETHTLRWADVDLRAGSMSIHATKTGQTRHVPICGPLCSLLANAQASADELVVQRSTNNHHRDAKFAAEKAGVEIWSDFFQSLRRSFATEVRQAEGSFMESVIFGHSQRVADDHYDLRRSPEHHKTLRDKLSENPSWNPQWRHDGSLEGTGDASAGRDAEDGHNSRSMPGFASGRQWPRPDSNRGPSDYESPALDR